MSLFELHAHTSECDLAAHATAAELVRIYHAAGYSGMVITDHYFATFYKWFAAELEGKTHREIMARRLRGYYEARNEGEKLGFTVLPGAEVRFNKSPYGINDFLVYGCDEEFFLTAPRLNELTSLDELKAILPENACVVLAHPFRVKMTVMDPAPLFGIEAYNGLTEPFRNAMAEDYARHFGKPVTAGSDCHHPDHACKGGIVTDRVIRTPKDLTDVLRSGEYTLYRGN
jgi:predicted metal-dependent phosphoesterase TrpH